MGRSCASDLSGQVKYRRRQTELLIHPRYNFCLRAPSRLSPQLFPLHTPHIPILLPQIIAYPVRRSNSGPLHPMVSYAPLALIDVVVLTCATPYWRLRYLKIDDKAGAAIMYVLRMARLPSHLASKELHFSLLPRKHTPSSRNQSHESSLFGEVCVAASCPRHWP